MTLEERIELALSRAVEEATRSSPPTLTRALEWAVFPGGGRVRPRLLVAVATACGNEDPRAAEDAAAALELLHCASLVHDDMPCFDDAELRRGRATVHRAFGEEIALLVGDALIVEAFSLLARAMAQRPDQVASAIAVLAAASNASTGIVAGQAWESESEVDVDRYHRAKTASLFEAAAALGALVAGTDPTPWREVGRRIGEAYQTADDILDAAGDEEGAGKPVGQDAGLSRPTVVATLGLAGAVHRLDELVARAQKAVPQAPGRAQLVALIEELATRLCPPALRARCQLHQAPPELVTTLPVRAVS